MEIVFNNTKLTQLYETGKSNKYKLNKEIIEKFIEVVAILESSKDIHDLWKLPSLNFERLQGFSDRYSARINRQYRLEMTIEWTDTECIVGVIGLEEISNHYGGK